MARRVCVIGGGAAGLMAAVYAARAGAQVTLLEKNEKTGKKLYITGKGRCNLTNDCDREELLKNLVRNPRFLYASLSLLDNRGIMDLFERLGVKLKTERGARVFPESDHASDISGALERELRRLGADLRLGTGVKALAVSDGAVSGVVLYDGRALAFERVIVATGGLSYPSTGSTGEGHAFLKAQGHSIIPCRPALTPIETNEEWCAELMGLSLKNVTLSAYAQGEGKRRRLFGEMGELLFTHFGISGPLALTLSSLLPENCRGTALYIDLKPALDAQTLDARLLREFGAMPNRQLNSCMDALEPHALGVKICELAGISPCRPVNGITACERKALAELIKGLPLSVKALRGMNEAIITRGGVNTKEINPSTLESKLVKGVYVAGEIIDVDALTGGFNLTIAFSTGARAGLSAAGA